MNGTRLNLIVVRAADLDAAARFYAALGITFTRERHGAGPEHLAADLGGAVFEVYPAAGAADTCGVRLGFRVASLVPRWRRWSRPTGRCWRRRGKARGVGGRSSLIPTGISWS